MIKTTGGKYTSIRTEQEENDLLASMYSNLSHEQKIALKMIMDDLKSKKNTGKETIFDLLTQSEYKGPVIGIEQFMDDKYYLGESCENIFPVLKQDLIDLFAGNYREVILTGGIGSGKTYVSSIATCYLLYIISMMRDPHKAFGLSRDSNISFVSFSVNENLAMKVTYENIATKVKISPYFREKFPFRTTRKELRFPGNIWVAARATTDTSALGLNVFGAIIDEANFMAKSVQSVAQHASHVRWGHVDYADMLYRLILRRMKSRFQRHGRIPGMLFILSSKKTEYDFTKKRIDEAALDPEVFVRDYAVFESQPEDRFSKNKFHVLVGNERVQSRILDEEEVEGLKDVLEPGCEILAIPEDFEEDFKRDIDGSIRDIAGRSTVAISPLIQNRQKVYDCIDKSRQHPISVVAVDLSKPWEWISASFLNKKKIKTKAGGTRIEYEPIINPGAPRYARIDLSLNKCSTGLAVGHVSHNVELTKYNAETQTHITESLPYIYIDLMIKIVPPLNGEIDFAAVRSIIYELNEYGFNIQYVSTDQFQSEDMIQQFKRNMIEASKISVDRTSDPYKYLRSAIYDGRISFYKYNPFLEEIISVEYDAIKNKVTLPNRKGASKDVADAVAGLVYSLTNHAQQNVAGFIIAGTPTDESNVSGIPIITDNGFRDDDGSSGPGGDMTPPFIVG